MQQNKNALGWMRGLLAFAVVGMMVGGAPALAGRLQTGDAVPPPLGFVKFCVENMEDCLMAPQAEEAGTVRLDRNTWRDLMDTQRQANQAFVPTNDIISVGFRDDWSYGRAGQADCEDFALVKRQMLMEKGWPASALLLTTAFTEEGEYHVVLTVVTDKGDVVLDNRYATPRPLETIPYQWVSRQDSGNPLRWVRVDGDAPRFAQHSY